MKSKTLLSCVLMFASLAIFVWGTRANSGSLSARSNVALIAPSLMAQTSAVTAKIQFHGFFTDALGANALTSPFNKTKNVFVKVTLPGNTQAGKLTVELLNGVKVSQSPVPVTKGNKNPHYIEVDLNPIVNQRQNQLRVVWTAVTQTNPGQPDKTEDLESAPISVTVDTNHHLARQR